MNEEILASLTLEQLKAMPIVINISPPVKPKFYAHLDAKTHEILGVSPQLTEFPDRINLEIEYELAEKFLTGKENIFLWVAVSDKDVLRLVKKRDLKSIKRDRTDVLRLIEVPVSDTLADITVEICKDHMLLHYDGEKIKYIPEAIKIYVTGEQNPANLKYTFMLDVNILNKIVAANDLPEWPNPIKLPIDDPLDVSIYSIKSNMTMAVIKNEELHN